MLLKSCFRSYRMPNECIWKASLSKPAVSVLLRSTQRRNILKTCEILYFFCPCLSTCSKYFFRLYSPPVMKQVGSVYNLNTHTLISAPVFPQTPLLEAFFPNTSIKSLSITLTCLPYKLITHSSCQCLLTKKKDALPEQLISSSL